jgi:hypothetical protein
LPVGLVVGARKVRCPLAPMPPKYLQISFLFHLFDWLNMNQVMKEVKFYFGILFLITFFLFTGCCRKKLEIIPTSRTFTSKIQNVQTGRIINGRYLATSSFYIGDQANIRILAVDKDMDIHKVYIRGYYPKNAETPHLKYCSYGLESQLKDRVSFFLKEPFNISGPPGEWRIDIQVEDEERNLSNLYKIFLIVH